jgi:hypothetical protein
LKKLFLGFVLCLCSIATAQNTENTDSYTKSLEDADVLIQDAIINITFKLDKRNQKITVSEESLITFKSIKERADMLYPIFYDNESSVEKFEILNDKGRKNRIRIRDEAYSSNDIFHQDARVKYTGLSFPLKGEELTVRYEKETFDLKYFTSIYFQKPFPVQNIIYNFEIPDWLNIELKEFHFENAQVSKSVKDGKSKTLSFFVKNLAPSTSDSYVLGRSYYEPHILILGKSFMDGKDKVVLFENTKDLYGWYKSLVDEVEVDDSAYKEKVNELISTANTDDEKIKNIYYWVQDNIKYIAFEDGIAGFKPDAPQNVYNKRFGDCKGMAILTKHMLKEAGFDARVVWIGTDRIAYDYTTPNLSVDNHMICAVMRDNKPIFLDATEKYNKYGEFASRIQGKQSLIENGADFILAKVPLSKIPNKETLEAKFAIEGDYLTGAVNRAYYGESRVQFQNGFTNLQNDEKYKVLTKYLEQGNTHFAVSEVSPFDSELREKPLMVTHKLQVKGAASSFSNVDYVDLSPLMPVEFFEIKEKTTDFFHPYAGIIENSVSVKVPTGKKVGTLLAPLTISHPGYSIKLYYVATSDSITLKTELDVKERLLKQNVFEQWNTDVKKVKEFYAEQITFL